MTTTTEPFTLTADDFEKTYYGVPVCSSGEDGDMLALGHHDARRVLAACNRYARKVIGFDNLADDRRALADEWLGSITEHWGVPRKATEDEMDNEGFSWCLDRATADTPGAIAYTWLAAS